MSTTVNVLFFRIVLSSFISWEGTTVDVGVDKVGVKEVVLINPDGQLFREEATLGWLELTNEEEVLLGVCVLAMSLCGGDVSCTGFIIT